MDARAAALEASAVGRDVMFTPYQQPDGPGQIWMTDEQLQRAALRLTSKTRLAGGDVRAGRSDSGTDAALVAEKFLKMTGEDRVARAFIHESYRLLKERELDLSRLKMHPSIQLASGDYYDFLDPASTPLWLEDMAAGLSRICRYTGQLNIDEDDIYSVAQHSVLASENCDPDCDPLEALLHDRAESVMNDMASPLKQLLPDYKAIEDRVEAATAAQYGVPHPMSPACKRIDLRMLATEKRDLMPGNMAEDKWALLDGVEPLPFQITPWRPSEARHRFLQRYLYLTMGMLPSPNDPYAQPHPNAPQAWKDAVYGSWGMVQGPGGQWQHPAFRQVPA